MLNFGPTFIWVAINLAILYMILKRFLFKPVTEFMKKRAVMISESIENSKRAHAEAEELKKEYEKRLKTAKAEADRILEEARLRASAEYEAIVGESRREAERLIEKAKEAVEQERIKMLKDIRNQVASLALAAASKVIEANMDTERNRMLVERFLDKEGAA